MKKGSISIGNLYLEHTGKVSDKWTRYLAEYDLLFAELRDKPVRLLELGVQNGGGLEIWANYFGKGEKFIGCDINPDCDVLHFDDPRIALVVGDANTDTTQEGILSRTPEFDIVIDDGSHRSGDVIRSSLRYFPVLVDGGVYVVEDLHTSYWMEYDGGLFDPFSSITFFKRLVDIINYEHWGIERNPSDILAGFCEKYGMKVETGILQHIHSIKFVNSLCIILKSQPSENNLGLRLIAGKSAEIYSDVLQLDESYSVPPSQTQNPWSILIHPPDEVQIEYDQKIDKLSAELESSRQEVAGYVQSTSWKITKPIRILKDLLLRIKG